MFSPNPELQGPAKNPDPAQKAHLETPEHRNPEPLEGARPLTLSDAGEDCGQSRPNTVSHKTVQWPVSSEVTLALVAVRDFLSGGSTAPALLDSKDAEVRQLIAAELLAAMTEDNGEATLSSSDRFPSRFEQEDNGGLIPPPGPNPGQQRQERARQSFIDYGYLDEAISALRSTESPQERAHAARTLGVVGSQRGTASLIAALFDDASEVRKAAEKSLSQIGDPSVSIEPTSTMVSRDIDYGAPSGFVLEAEAAQVQETVIESSGEGVNASVRSNAKSSVDRPMAADSDAVAKTLPAFEQLDQIRNSIAELERLLVQAVEAREEADKEALVRAQQESDFRAEAAARRREDEEARKRAEEKAVRRRSEDDRKLAAEQLGRLQAGLEAQRLAEEEERLRVEVTNLRQTAHEMLRQRAEVEASEFAQVAEIRRREAENSLGKAHEQCNAELKRLRTEEEALHRAIAEASAQRTEVEAKRREVEEQARLFEREKNQLGERVAARDAEMELLREAEAQARGAQDELHMQVKALVRMKEEIAARQAELDVDRANLAAEMEQLKEAQERIAAAEITRRKAEAERLQLEEKLAEQIENEQRLLAAVRSRIENEQQRLEETSRRRAEEQDRLVEELETLRVELEEQARHRVEKERRLNSEIERLRSAELESLTRIGEVEALRNRAEEAHHLAAEKVQRIEAEASRQTMEDQRVLDKLEETCRNLNLEAHARSEQERHLKEDIQDLRRLEKEERARVAEVSSSRAEAEIRLRRERERLKLEEQALAKTESQIEYLLQGPQGSNEAGEWSDDPVENLRLVRRSAIEADPEVGAAVFVASAYHQTPVVPDRGEASFSSQSFLGDLRSADPNKRVVALAGLSRHGGTEAFGLIAGCFDDPSPAVRNAAARALRDRAPDLTVESFTRAIEEGSAERSRNIGVAIAASNLAREALLSLNGESREDTYKALSLLFVMAKTGEIQPLVQAIEEHPEPEVCGAAIKLLNLSGQSGAAEAALQRRREEPRDQHFHAQLG